MGKRHTTNRATLRINDNTRTTDREGARKARTRLNRQRIQEFDQEVRDYGYYAR
jgi:hypothetical protein